MSYLLGSEYCVQSLSSDVSDLQSSVKELMSKTGKINSISWKFPDKTACDLNVESLIKTYKYDANDSENNQISHIILLELIIDRASLLFQLYCEFIDSISEGDKKMLVKDKSNSGRLLSPCLGLIIKKHWSKFCNLSRLVDGLRKEISQLSNQNKELERELHDMKDKSSKTSNLVSVAEVAASNGGTSTAELSRQAIDWISNLDKDKGTGNCQSKRRPTVTGQISKDFGCKSSQTMDTAFKPCESCHISQTCLREACSAIVKLFQQESTQTTTASLSKLYREISAIEWLGDKKLLQIKECFNRDLEKLVRLHREILSDKIETEQKLETAKLEASKLSQHLENEREQSGKKIRILEESKCDVERKLDEQTQKWTEAVKELEQMKSELNLQIKDLKNQLGNMKVTLSDKEEIIQKFGVITRSMDIILNSHVKDPVVGIKQIERLIEQLQSELFQLKQDLSQSAKMNENLSETEQRVKEKEEKLLKRLQMLTEQKRKLEDNVDELQVEMETGNKRAKVVLKERDELENRVINQQKMIDELSTAEGTLQGKLKLIEEDKRQLTELLGKMEKEKELLVHFPDLNGPLEKYETDNIEEDLHNQLQSNCIRIELLTRQNLNFQNAINKLQQSATNIRTEIIDNSSLVNNNNNNISFRPAVDPGTRSTLSNAELSESQLQYKPESIESRRPPSTTILAVHSSRIQSGRHSRKGTQPESVRQAKSTLLTRTSPSATNTSSGNTDLIVQWSSGSAVKGGNSSQQLPCVCETCGRQYSQKSDLQIHKEYCIGANRRRRQQQQNR